MWPLDLAHKACRLRVHDCNSHCALLPYDVILNINSQGTIYHVPIYYVPSNSKQGNYNKCEKLLNFAKVDYNRHNGPRRGHIVSAIVNTDYRHSCCYTDCSLLTDFRVPSPIRSQRALCYFYTSAAYAAPETLSFCLVRLVFCRVFCSSRASQEYWTQSMKFAGGNRYHEHIKWIIILGEIGIETNEDWYERKFESMSIGFDNLYSP